MRIVTALSLPLAVAALVGLSQVPCATHAQQTKLPKKKSDRKSGDKSPSPEAESLVKASGAEPGEVMRFNTDRTPQPTDNRPTMKFKFDPSGK
jgi:hypothetical protein